MPRKYTTVAIGGDSNAGKTLLTTRLAERFPGSVVINQDIYFREEDDPVHEWIQLKSGRRHQNWEIMSSVNWEKLVEKCTEIYRQEPEKCDALLIIEGHLVLEFEHWPFPLDHKILLQIDHETCRQRREQRIYLPPDPEGYFEEFVWPKQFENRQEALRLHPDVVIHNGTEDIDTILEDVIGKINAKKHNQ